MKVSARNWWIWTLGTVRGIPIRAHVTLLVLLVWIGVDYALRGAGVTGTVLAFLLVAVVFAIIVVHELGHALVARHFGYRTRDIMLLPIGGIASFDRMPERPREELAVALVGPAINLALAAVLWLVLVVAGGSGLGHAILAQLVFINIVLAVFNLIPAFPMDGGRALRALLAMRLGRERATEIAAALGKVFAIGLAIYGLFYNPFLVLIGLVVWFGANQEAASVHLKSALAGVPVSAAMRTRIETIDIGQSLEDAAALFVAHGQDELPVLDHGRAIGVLTRADLAAALGAPGNDASVAVAPRHGIVLASPDDPLDLLVDRLREAPDAVALVVDREHLVGIVAPHHLLAYVDLRGRGAA